VEVDFEYKKAKLHYDGVFQHLISDSPHNIWDPSAPVRVPEQQ
jgi:hypothetical protein